MEKWLKKWLLHLQKTSENYKQNTGRYYKSEWFQLSYETTVYKIQDLSNDIKDKLI